MSIRRIAQEEEESLAATLPRTFLIYVVAGVGLGLGFFLLRKAGVK